VSADHADHAEQAAQAVQAAVFVGQTRPNLAKPLWGRAYVLLLLAAGEGESLDHPATAAVCGGNAGVLTWGQA